MVSGEGGFFWQRYSIKSVFADIEGLKEGAPVRVAGVEIGSVTEMDFIGDKVEVTMDVSKDQQPRITDRSVGVAGIDVAAGRGGRRHHAQQPGQAGPGMGICAGAAPRRGR